MKRCVIVGAGIIGQLCALELNDRGWHDITIVETLDVPPASWAGGGILSPLFPWRYSQAMNALCHNSVGRYRALMQRLIKAGLVGGGELNISGMWMEVCPEEKPLAITWIDEFQGGRFEWERRVIAGNAREGLWFPDLGSVRNPRLLKALRSFLLSRGVVFRQEKVHSCKEYRDGSVAVGFVSGAVDYFDKAILAAGSGVASITGFEEMFFPAKGEMLLYRLGGRAPSEVILAHEGYCIPRSNGDTLVGSTLRIGDDTCYPTVSGRYTLEKMAAALLPQTVGSKPAFHWAGVRPGFRRDRPVICSMPSQESIFIAAGHYRNGLVSAPATAELLAQLVCGEKPFIDPSHYSFSSSRSSSSFLSR